MTNEEAIITLERSNVMLKEQISALKKGYSLLEKSDVSAYQTIEYCESEYAAVELALAALREKQERSKGCVWCKSDSQVTHNGEHFCFFCSYCGKRLEVEP